MTISEMYPSVDSFSDNDSEELKKKLEQGPIEILDPKLFKSPEYRSLDSYAKNIDPQEIERLKNKYQVDFYKSQPSEVFCHQLEDILVHKITELENCHKDLDYQTDKLRDRNNVEEETAVYQEGQSLVEEIKKLLTDYKQYIDAVSPEVATVYDIPEELKFNKHGRSFNIKETLDYIEQVDVQFGQVKDKDGSHLKYTNSQLDHKPLHSFGVIRQEDPETKEVSYKLFRKNDFTKDNQVENNIVVTDQDEWEQTNIESYYEDKGLKYFKDNPEGQLRLLAKLFKMYDLPEFNVGQADFHSSINAIRDIIQKKHDTFSAHDPSVYIKQRKFLAKQIEMFGYLSSHLGYTHQTNQLRRLDEKDHRDYLKAQ